MSLKGPSSLCSEAREDRVDSTYITGNIRVLVWCVHHFRLVHVS